MSKAAAKTGLGPTVVVAVEQHFPKEERIIEDPLSYSILPGGMRWFVKLLTPSFMRDWMIRTSEKNTPGLWNGMLCRKKYIDEKLIDRIPQTDAIVNLGAGYDTRVFRLEPLHQVPVWEIDQEEIIQSKEKQLCRVLGSIPDRIKLMPIDFDQDELWETLMNAGFDPKMRTFFIWEAVTQYLTEEGVHSTLRALSHAASGSRMAFTYVVEDFLKGNVPASLENLYKQYVEKNIWLFGKNPDSWNDFLKNYGWAVIEDRGYDELAQQYLQQLERNPKTLSIERMVLAEKM